MGRAGALARLAPLRHRNDCVWRRRVEVNLTTGWVTTPGRSGWVSPSCWHRRDHVARPGADHACRGCAGRGRGRGAGACRCGGCRSWSRPASASACCCCCGRPCSPRCATCPAIDPRRQDGRQQRGGDLADRQVRRRDQGGRPELDRTSLFLGRGDRAGHRDRGLRDRRSHRCRLPEARATPLPREGRSWSSHP